MNHINRCASGFWFVCSDLQNIALDFVILSEKTVQLIHSRKEELHSELVGSWTVQVGDLDQVLHLWKHTGGFAGIDSASKIIKEEKVDYSTYF